MSGTGAAADASRDWSKRVVVGVGGRSRLQQLCRPCVNDASDKMYVAGREKEEGASFNFGGKDCELLEREWGGGTNPERKEVTEGKVAANKCSPHP